MELIAIGTAVAVVRDLFGRMDEIGEAERDKYLKLIRARMERYQLAAQMVKDGEIRQELQDAVEAITPERICRAVAMDELGQWCSMIRNDIILALKGMKLGDEEDEE